MRGRQDRETDIVFFDRQGMMKRERTKLKYSQIKIVQRQMKMCTDIVGRIELWFTDYLRSFSVLLLAELILTSMV